VSTGTATLRIELEDVGGTSWWEGWLSKLVSPSGHTHMRFVGHVEGQRRRYRSSTFRAPRTLGTLPPQEEWEPGMILSLNELRHELKDDGWVEVGHGAEPWALRFERAIPATG
jgi:hypothetical protein